MRSGPRKLQALRFDTLTIEFRPFAEKLYRVMERSRADGGFSQAFESVPAGAA